MKIEIYAVGCAKCRLLEVATHAALEELGLNVEVEKVNDIEMLKEKGVMSQPALLINGKLKTQGVLPSIDDIKEMINQERGVSRDPSIV